MERIDGPLELALRWRGDAPSLREIERVVSEWQSLQGKEAEFLEFGVDPPNTLGVMSAHVDGLTDEQVNLLRDFLRARFKNLVDVELSVDAEPASPAAGRIFVPAGRVQLGDETWHEVDAFWAARQPVTIGEFEQFQKETGYCTTAELAAPDRCYKRNPELAGTTPAERGQIIISYVSLIDCLAYAEWAGGRVPTEAMWLAASIVDWTVYSDRDAFRKRLDELISHPRSIVTAGDEWCLPLEDDASFGLVRGGPILVREGDWRVRYPTRRLSPEFFSPNIGFRICWVP